MKDLKRRVIGLITDFGVKGLHYVATLKAVILKINPNVQIIDINHNVTPFNIYEASFLISTTYKYFPRGSVFIVVVDPGVGSSRDILAIKLVSDYYFIGPNNGIFTNAFKSNDIIECIKIDNDDYFIKPVSNTFHGRDIMAPVGAYITKNVELENFGPKFDSKNFVHYPIEYKVSSKERQIKGIIQYIDQFGNGITNIPIKDNKVGGSLLNLDHGDLIQFRFNKKEYIGTFTSFYSSQPLNALLFIRGSTNFLEISINQGNAAKQIGFKVGDTLIFKVKE
ncbi:MAG: S-adenosyl-l-methionine hydroxide adenosyltransferase family protein [Candidatus Odinarchaeota archaeon]